MNINSTAGMTTSRSWPVLVATLMYLSHFTVWALFTALVVYAEFHLTSYFPGISGFGHGLLAGVACCFIVLGFPVNPRATSPAPRLKAKDQPRLFERLHKIALSCGQPVPLEVELTMYPAIQLSVPGMDSRPRKGVIEVGLPLFHWLTVSPPLMEGFQTYVKSGVHKNDERHHDAEEPTLQQRLAAIEHLPVHAAEDSTPAISLLDNVPELEALAISAESNPPGKKLRLMPWGQIGQFVILPKWEEDCAEYSSALKNLTLEQLPQAVAENWHRRILAEAFGLLLSRAGWYIDYGPGYLRMCRGEETIVPRKVIEEMANPGFTGEKWLEMLKKWKLDPALPLGEG